MGQGNIYRSTIQSTESKAEAYQRIESILEAGPFIPGLRAVHRAHFLYELYWSQVQARIHEMNAAGWTITSIDLPKSEWVKGIRTAYRLDSKPLRPGEDWYVQKTGKPRPPSTTTVELPLFDLVRQ